MRILAIDTTTEACSVALYHSKNEASVGSLGSVDNEFDPSHCVGLYEVCPQQHSQQILPMIDRLLTANDTKISDLDAIAYGRGPGSFTGVRIAASTVQGLALGANLPVLQISTLATMAQQAYQQSGCKNVIAAIDARMNEVYFAHFSLDTSKGAVMQPAIEEAVISPEHALDYIQKQQDNGANDLAFVGSGFASYADLFANCIGQNKADVAYPNAEFLLPLAFNAYISNHQVLVENVQPVYVRDTVTWKKLPNKQ